MPEILSLKQREQLTGYYNSRIEAPSEANGSALTQYTSELHSPTRPVEALLPSVIEKLGISRAQDEALCALVERFERIFGKDNHEAIKHFSQEVHCPYTVEREALSRIATAQHLHDLSRNLSSKNTRQLIDGLGVEAFKPLELKVKAAFYHVIDQFRSLYQFEF